MTGGSDRHTVSGCSDCPFAGLDFPGNGYSTGCNPVHPVICQHPSRRAQGGRQRVERTLSQLADEGAPDDCPLRKRPLLITLDTERDSVERIKPPLLSCAAGNDGECNDPRCPQNRDGEPDATGRSCPLPHWSDYLEEL